MLKLKLKFEVYNYFIINEGAVEDSRTSPMFLSIKEVGRF